MLVREQPIVVRHDNHLTGGQDGINQPTPLAKRMVVGNAIFNGLIADDRQLVKDARRDTRAERVAPDGKPPDTRAVPLTESFSNLPSQT